jgi:predicted RNA-binding Zn ribbon-like protein
VTGQVKLDSYADTGVRVAIDLINAVALRRRAADAPATDAEVEAILGVLAVDPPSVAQFDRGDAPALIDLARRLHGVFGRLHAGDVDGAAGALNRMLAESPSHPQLAKENGHWRLHHHPVDAALVPMWTAICAEALARMVGAGHGGRFGVCDAPRCGRVFVDLSKNGSRAFCSTSCQNRVKAAAFRRRRLDPAR